MDESQGAVALYTNLQATPCCCPILFLKSFWSPRGFLQGPCPTQSRPPFFCSHPPSLLHLLSFPSSSLDESTILSKTNTSVRALWLLLLSALTPLILEPLSSTLSDLLSYFVSPQVRNNPHSHSPIQKCQLLIPYDFVTCPPVVQSDRGFN